MTQHITATYSNGVFSPDAPVALSEGTKVDLTITLHEDLPMTPQEALKNLDEIADRIQIPADFKWLTREELNDRHRH